MLRVDIRSVAQYCKVYVIVWIAIKCSGKNCRVRFQNGKMVREGDCEAQDDHPVIQDLMKKVRNRAFSPLPGSCKDVVRESAKIKGRNGGVYDIEFSGVGKFEVYCDTETDGGGWTVFQRRMDGSVDFYLNWTDYKTGFGQKQGEFWLGLDTIHRLTKNRDQELRIDMITKDGVFNYATYGSFSIGPSSDKYRLWISGYSGNTTNDNIVTHVSQPLNNTMFSTKDSDNDQWKDGNCASLRKGAWWYKSCARSNLNGAYEKNDDTGVFWHPSNMRFTEMKFRKKE